MFRFVPLALVFAYHQMAGFSPSYRATRFSTTVLLVTAMVPFIVLVLAPIRRWWQS